MMRRACKLGPAALSALLLAVPGHAATGAAEPPALSGKVVRVEPGGRPPLAEACVELLTPRSAFGDEQVLYRSYTDPQGRFVFPWARAGEYDMRVTFGRQVLYQVAQSARGARAVERRRLRLPDRPARLPEVVVQTAPGAPAR